jgi:aspartate kinase
VHVLKFGSSVLASPDGYRSVAGHVRDEVARGRKVIAVGSAMGSATDALLTSAKAVARRPPDALVSALLATGEEASVALLGIALADVGVPSTGFTAARLSVRTRGALWDAEPVDVDTGPIAAALDCSDVIIVPGFVGVDYVTPFDIVGDFVYNFNEFGQIVITNFADVLNAGKSVEEAMETAQVQAEDLADRIS